MKLIIWQPFSKKGYKSKMTEKTSLWPMVKSAELRLKIFFVFLKCQRQMGQSISEYSFHFSINMQLNLTLLFNFIILV